jgi:two-component system response regulator LytT
MMAGMRTIRVIVAEDEPASRAYLVGLLSEHPGVEVVGEAGNGREALRLVSELDPDGLFLDIEMPLLRGTDLLPLLPGPRPAVVFVTAYADHALEAIQGGAVHYLLKPITRIGVAQALARIPTRQGGAEGLRLPVRRRGTTTLFRPEEVDALVADLGDCEAWTREGKVHLDGTLAQWEERLAGCGFLRVHRNALVRLEAVRELTDDDEVVLGCGRIPISRRRVEELKKALGMPLQKTGARIAGAGANGIPGEY